MIHMALHLKSINPRASEYSRSVDRKKLRKFEDKSNLVRCLGKSMDAQHTANRPLGFDGKLSEFLDMKDEGACALRSLAPEPHRGCLPHGIGVASRNGNFHPPCAAPCYYPMLTYDSPPSRTHARTQPLSPVHTPHHHTHTTTLDA